MASTPSNLQSAEISALLERGETGRCVELSELSEVIEALELDDEDVETLNRRREGRGIEVRDDCGSEAESTRNERRALAHLAERGEIEALREAA